MSKNRYVNTAFWDDDYISELSWKEKLLFLYLLTSPLTSICGAFEISLRRIAFDTGMEISEIRDFLGKFQSDQKIYYVDGKWIVLRNFLKHQTFGAKMQMGINYEVAKLPPNIAVLVERGTPITRNKRTKVSATKRKRILERDNYACAFCGKNKGLEIDHITPVIAGGTSEESNLRVLCESCNGKRNAELRWHDTGVEWVPKNRPPINMGNNNSNSNSNSNSNNTNVEILQIYDIYLKAFKKNGNAYKLTDKRKSKIAARLKDCGRQMLEEAIRKTSESPWHRPGGEWGKANLDFIIRNYEQVERLSQLDEKHMSEVKRLMMEKEADGE